MLLNCTTYDKSIAIDMPMNNICSYMAQLIKPTTEWKFLNYILLYLFEYYFQRLLQISR